MATYLSGLKRLSFDGITIPYAKIRVTGGQREHVHEFPKVPGGLPELFGRKLYEINITGRIDEGIMRAGGYYMGRNLFSDLNLLASYWEIGIRGSLYLPNIGEIKAYATSWTRELETKVTSGESFEVSFREDSDSATMLAQTLLSQPTAATATALGAFTGGLPTPHDSIFDTIRNAVNGILAFKDQGEMWAGFMSMKLQGLFALFEQAYVESAAIWNDPLNFQLLEDFKALWSACQQMQDSGGQLLVYVTPKDTDVSGASILIYGDTAHATDLLNLNALPDPYSIPAGTSLNYFAAA